MGEKSLLRPNDKHAIGAHSGWHLGRLSGGQCHRPCILCSLQLLNPNLMWFWGKSSMVQASKVDFHSPTQLFESLPPTSPQDAAVMRRHPSKQALCTSKQKLVPTVCPFKRTIKMPFCTLLFPRAHTLSILRRDGAYL